MARGHKSRASASFATPARPPVRRSRGAEETRRGRRPALFARVAPLGEEAGQLIGVRAKTENGRVHDQGGLNARTRWIPLTALIVVILTSALVTVLVNTIPTAAAVVGILGFGTSAVLGSIGAWYSFRRVRASGRTRAPQGEGADPPSVLRRRWLLVLFVVLVAAALTAVRISAYLR